MPKQNTRLSTEAIQSIRDMLKEKKPVESIAFKLGVTKNCVYYHLKQMGIVINPAASGKKPRPKKLLEECDYSTLSDDVLFNPSMFPVF